AKAKLAAVQGANPKGFAKKATPSLKVGRTRTSPSNQHKVNPGPTKAKSSREEFQGLLLDALVTELNDMQEGVVSVEALKANWPIRSGKILDRVLAEFETSHPENPEDPTNDYTKQVRQGLPLLKGMLSQTTDPEMLAVMVDAWDGEDNGYAEME